MKKRVFAGIMIATMMIASVMSVSAADSKEGIKVEEAGSSLGKYVANNAFEDADEVTGDVKTAIEKIDKNDFTTLPTEIQKELKGKTILSPVFDLDPVGEHPNCPPYNVTLKVDGLTKSCTEVVLLHYSTVKDAWEVIETDVDYDAKTINFDIEDFSPATVVAKVATGSGSDDLSYQTEGVSFTWMLWVAAALVVVGTGIVVSQKKNRK